ncbi:uncharacterized protein [Ambystoma mexicanum]|uniref:uncharacterized protein isoform X2 n=1 Tax=Ambystoma mexicanum TaxID=8296 RepID=UPI0037E8A8E7
MQVLLDRLLGRGLRLRGAVDPGPARGLGVVVASLGQDQREAAAPASHLELSVIGGGPTRDIPEGSPGLSAGEPLLMMKAPAGLVSDSDATVGKGDCLGVEPPCPDKHDGGTGSGPTDQDDCTPERAPSPSPSQSEEPESKDAKDYSGNLEAERVQIPRSPVLGSMEEDLSPDTSLTSIEVVTERSSLDEEESDRLLQSSPSPSKSEKDPGSLSPWNRIMNLYCKMKRSPNYRVPQNPPTGPEGHSINITVYGSAVHQPKLFRMFKSTDTVGFLEDQLKSMLDVSCTAQLWKKCDDSGRERLDKLDITLEQAGITHGEILLLEKVEEGFASQVPAEELSRACGKNWLSMKEESHESSGAGELLCA